MLLKNLLLFVWESTFDWRSSRIVLTLYFKSI